MNQSGKRFAELRPTSAETSINQQSSNYAGFWLRVFASVIDIILIYIIVFALIFASIFIGLTLGFLNLATDADAESLGKSLGSIYGLLVNTLWYCCFESSRYQGTPGKILFKLKVTDTDSNKISFGRAFLRYTGKWVSALTLLIGFMMAGWTEQKQALHDKIVDTLVIRRS